LEFNAKWISLEMTTEELLPKLDTLDIAKETLSQLKSLFRSTDPVKFADVPAPVGKMRQDLEFVKNFILEGGRRSSPAS
jgi:hypothetical protein